MSATEKTISSLIKGQLPDFVRADHPKFKRFLELYYQWLETDDPNGISAVGGNTVYQAMNIGDYRDIDQTPDEFITFFKRELLPYFPEKTALDIRKILKSAREFYIKKGSVDSVKWLFKALFNEDIEITYPKDQILKTSDGKWKQPKAFRVTVGETNKNVDVNLLKKRIAVGSVSGATCIIESANRTIDSDTGKEIIEIYISNIKRYFNNGEYIKVNYIDANGISRVFSEKIIGTISNVYLDSNIKTDPQQKRRGLLYNVGDPVVITGGLALSAEAQPGVAIVGNVTLGSIEAVTTIFPGYGYTLYPNTEVIALRSIGDDPNANANTDLRVFALNLNSNANSQSNFIEEITFDKAVIDYLGETLIGASDLEEFTSNNFNAVINVTEADANDGFDDYEQVWANGNNYFDALFTAKIATSNISGPFGQEGAAATDGLLVYDVVGANTQLSLETILAGQNIYTKNTAKSFTYNSVTLAPVLANADSQLFQCLRFETVNTGGIALIQVKNGGGGFRSAPSLLIKSEYETILSESPLSNHTETVQTFKDLGLIAHVYINNGGSGYANGDTLTFSGRGYGGNGYVTANETGSIVSVTLTDRGEGHLIRPEVYVDRSSVSYTTLTGTATVNAASRIVKGSGTSFSIDLSPNKIIKINDEIRKVTSVANATSLVVNTAFTADATSQTIYKQDGDEATLTAYLFGDGFESTVSTSLIGRIKDIRLLYRGYDYVARPNVSLKIVDTVINPIAEIDNFIEEEYIYQGTSLETSTFRANVKSYTRNSNILRLYDFSGTIDTTRELITANGLHCSVNTAANVAAPSQYPSTVIATGLPNPMYYGDGRAKALAAFANGLIEFNGFYVNTDGFLSADKVLEDGHIYHNYSYVIQSQKDLADYKTSLKNIAHPSGLITISKRVVLSENDTESETFNQIDYIKPTNLDSNVQIANSYSNVVIGNNTAFLYPMHKVNVGDLFIISDSNNPLRSISKIVSNVGSDTELEVYGDFIYVGQGKASTNSGNNWLHISGATNTVSSFVQNGDQIRMNLISWVPDGKVDISSTSITSHPTHFVGNVIIGNEISVNNEVRLVTSVDDDTTLTVNSAFTDAVNKVASLLGDRVLGGTVNVNPYLTGTVNVTASTVLVGNNTVFTTELNVNDIITVNNQTRYVSSITNNEHLIVDSAYTQVGTDNVIFARSDVITGFGTYFVGNLTVGVSVSVNNEIRNVATIVSDSELIVDYPFINNKSNSAIIRKEDGKILDGMVDVSGTSVTYHPTHFVGNVVVGSEVTINNETRIVTDINKVVTITPDQPITIASNSIVWQGSSNTVNTFNAIVDAWDGSNSIVTLKTVIGNFNPAATLRFEYSSNGINYVNATTAETATEFLTVNSAFAHAATDKYLVANTVLIKNVSSVFGNNIIMNSAYFVTKTNIVYQVVPDYSSADYDYKIITLTGN